MKVAVVFFLAIPGFSPVRADETEKEERKFSLTLSSQVWSDYVVFFGRKIHEGPLLQSDAFLQFPYGFSADIWHSAGLNGGGFSSDLADEIDYTLGWGKDFGIFSFNTALSYFDIIELFDGPKEDRMKFKAEAGKSFALGRSHSLTPFLRTESVFSANIGAHQSGGTMATIGVQHNATLAPFLQASQSLGFGYDFGIFGLEEGMLWKYSAGLSWRLSKQVSLEVPMLKASGPVTVSDRDNLVVVGGGVTLRF